MTCYMSNRQKNIERICLRFFVAIVFVCGLTACGHTKQIIRSEHAQLSDIKHLRVSIEDTIFSLPANEIGVQLEKCSGEYRMCSAAGVQTTDKARPSLRPQHVRHVVITADDSSRHEIEQDAFQTKTSAPHAGSVSQYPVFSFTNLWVLVTCFLFTWFILKFMNSHRGH